MQLTVIGMCHVLVIEDEPMIAMLLQDVFEEAGATSFDFAATEHDAVRLAIEHTPAVIASDVHLIEGTGPSAVRRIHAELGAIPVIFITANPADCRPGDPPGLVIAKPVGVGQLKSAFQQVAPRNKATFLYPFAR